MNVDEMIANLEAEEELLFERLRAVRAARKALLSLPACPWEPAAEATAEAPVIPSVPGQGAHSVEEARESEVAPRDTGAPAVEEARLEGGNAPHHPEPPPIPPRLGRAPKPDTIAGRVVAYIRQNPGTTRSQVAIAIGSAVQHVNGEVRRMIYRGLVREENGHGSVMHLYAAELELPQTASAPAQKPEALPSEPRVVEVPRAAAVPTPFPAPRLRTVLPVVRKQAPVPMLPRVATPPTMLGGTRTIRVDAITSREDRFHCGVLHATLSAGACVQRQTAARSGKGGIGREARESRERAERCKECRDCAIGTQVAARIQTSAAE